MRCQVGNLAPAAVLFALTLSACVSESPLRGEGAASRRPSGVISGWAGQQCEVSIPSTRVVRTNSAWAAVWTALGKPAPKADFSKNFAVAVFLGRKPTGGFSVEFLSPRKDTSGALLIPYREKRPQGFVTQMISQPYSVRIFKGAPPLVRVISESP